MTDHCAVSSCHKSVQYHVQFTDKQTNYISSTHTYCRDHTKIGWYLPPKGKEKGKWVGGWIPSNIHSVHDKYGEELSVSQVKRATARY
mgnify:CR=1 FL=1